MKVLTLLALTINVTFGATLPDEADSVPTPVTTVTLATAQSAGIFTS